VAKRGFEFGQAHRDEGSPPPARQRHGAHLLDRRLEPTRGQCRDDKLALPGEIGSGLHVLEGAAAAGAEVMADRRDALGARLENGKRFGAGFARLGRDGHQLARKREGDE
jgi:hypothetical protein